ncbi:DUF4422 domain-containing protein [Rosenbergiella collisarenosi]|uniref:DUF4422 domain-containing protein n=1 Tax=Rosenbergiella collisarenosi TaxID=1544695 RepID=UPI001F501801|nr:DUF4422 domain-containing protein [Rosenbergiella collisarenosi]
MKGKIFIVSHKEFTPPKSEIYTPIAVGMTDFNSYYRDDCGDNISHLNSSFCELTAMYWVWKNFEEKDDYIVGLCHYRRYFKGREGIISQGEIENGMAEYDIITAKKRSYYFISVRNHYRKAHNYQDILLLRDEIKVQHPEYIESFEKVMNSNKLSLYNMLITKKNIFDEYCEWLFPLLFSIKDKINTEEYDVYQRRVIGFLSERMFNVWLEFNKKNYKIKEVAVFNTDGENRFKKGINLLKRQYLK